MDIFKEPEDIAIYANPHPKQEQFHNASAMYRMYGGQKGGGKSWAMRREGVRQSHSQMGIRGLMLRRTYDEIEQNTIIPLLTELPQDMYEYNSTKHVMTFTETGSTIKFSYCRTLKDVLRFQGVEFDWIGIEELTHRTFQERIMLMGSLRTSRDDYIPNFFASTNPGGVGHGRVKRLWINRDFSEHENPDDFSFVSASIRDNPTLLKNDPNYIRRLEMLPEKQKRAYLYGDRDIFDGQFFQEFNRDIHVIEPFIPKQNEISRRILVFDYGYTNQSACYWMAQDTQGDVYIYRELYITEQTYTMLAKKLKEMTTNEEKIDKVLGDPAIVEKKSEGTGVSAKDDFAKQGIKLFPANNDRIAGRNNMREFLKVHDDPNNPGKKKSRLYICSNCENLIRTLPEQIHDSTRVEDLDSDGEDHAVDAVRYGLAELGQMSKRMADVKELNEKFVGVDIKSQAHESRRVSNIPSDTNSNLMTKSF